MKLHEYPVPASFVLGDAPFINTWLITDPVPNSSPATMDANTVDAASCSPAPGRSFGNHQWYVFDDRIFNRNYDDYVDLFSYFRAKRHLPVAGAAVYAAVWLWSPASCAAQLRIGADSMFRAWFNGLPVGSADKGNTTGDPNPPAPTAWPNSYHCIRSDDAGKDMSQLAILLKRGWNLLVLKVGNKEEGLFGFYARVCQPDGKAIHGLIPSMAGPDQQLQAAPAEMRGCTPTLPVAFTEWPYVHTNHPLVAEAQTIWPEGRQLWSYVAQSSAYRLSAAGGSPPYKWKLVGGKLPKGLSLTDDGILHGLVSGEQPTGIWPLAFSLSDSTGRKVTMRTSITVKERPNRWYETARMNALIHGPDHFEPNDWPKLAKLMKDQGYAIGIPIGYGNGDWYFRFRNRFDPNAKAAGVHDIVKKALESAGLKYGMYIGNLTDSPQFRYEQVILMLEDVCKQYQPAAFWMDWLAIDHSSLDAIYSMIRTLLPDAVIVINGVERPTHGDWDICCVEEYSFVPEKHWGRWPNDIHTSTMQILKTWPKKHMLENWRPMLWPYKDNTEDTPDWQEYQRVLISLIGEGNIANFDHSPATGAIVNDMDFAHSHLMTAHTHMANWANKERTEPLYHAYTNIDNAPLPDQPWGYTTMSLDGRSLYLLSVKNPRGKTGLPQPQLTLTGLTQRVDAAVCMNNNHKLTFKQNGHTLNIDTSALQADPVSTIIKLNMHEPLKRPHYKPVPPEFIDRIPSPGNLATGKTVQMFTLDGTKTMGASMETCWACCATDGLAETFAEASGDYPWTLELDMNQLETISRIKFLFGDLYATSFTVSISEDRVHWKQIANDSGSSRAWEEYRFAPAKARYVWISAFKPDGPDQEGGQMTIADLQVYAK